MCKDDLQLLLAGKRVPKKLRKNQISIGIQTDDFLKCANCGKIDWFTCSECGMVRLIAELKRKAREAEREAELEEERRSIVEENGVFINTKTGEVVDYDVDYSRKYYR